MTDPISQPVCFDNSYARLPTRFFARVGPTPVATPTRVRVNRALAEVLGIDPDWLTSDEGTRVLAGNAELPGAEPIATVYAGHQFGHFNPQLGDGRAVLLGEVLTPDGERFDLQLKGSGETAYSRSGDGRSPLGPVLREYVVSEAMHTLGVPTTRALAAVGTGEFVFRERPLPGAVLTRIARSHIRIGTFEFFAARRDTEALHALTDHALERHMPAAVGSERPALELLRGVVERQARLVAQWMHLGFVHGVMNTDNMLVSGETIDYGPCAFMEAYHPGTVFSSIDHAGRYAFANQPNIARWNLLRLAEALLLVIDPDPKRAIEPAQQAVDAFEGLFQRAHEEGARAKLGLSGSDPEDAALFAELLEVMAEHGADFTLTFRRLAEVASPEIDADQDTSALHTFPRGLGAWMAKWRRRFAGDSESVESRCARMLRANPVFIPRNHLVEEAIEAGTERGDFEPFHRLVDRLRDPWTFDAEDARYATPATPKQQVLRTFCGT